MKALLNTLLALAMVAMMFSCSSSSEGMEIDEPENPVVVDTVPDVPVDIWDGRKFKSSNFTYAWVAGSKIIVSQCTNTYNIYKDDDGYKFTSNHIEVDDFNGESIWFCFGTCEIISDEEIILTNTTFKRSATYEYDKNLKWWCNKGTSNRYMTHWIYEVEE